MTTLREAATQALGALEDFGMKHYENTGELLHKDVYESLKAALAEPVQEPVAWMLTEREKYGNAVVVRKHKPKTYDSSWWTLTPLYTAPPQRKPLTREEAIALWADKSDGPSNSEIVLYCRAIVKAAAEIGRKA